MKKNLALQLSLLFALVLSLQSCRTGEDYLSAKEEQYYSNKFQVFTSFNDESVDYTKGFKTLMENYDGIHKTHYTRTSAIKSGNLGKSDEEYVEFRLHSQSMLLEDDERWIIYPMVKNGQVSGLMAGILRNEETEVEFRKLDSGNDYYDEVFKIFSMAYLKNKLKSGLNKGGGCGFDSDDACDIGNIDISPPKGGLKGTGPKSGCTGLNNCIKPEVNPGGGGGPGGNNSPYVEPCEKTKILLNKPKVQQGINDLKAQALKTLSDMKTGEIGFKEKKDGTLAPADVNGDHKVVFNDVTDSYGGYHNHTATGTHMFSPPDIADALFGFAAGQSVQDGPGNAYLGMIAAEWCNTCPNNAQYIHYVIKYTGTGTELGNYVYTEAQMKQFENNYRQIAGDLADTSINGSTYVKNSAGDLNEKGLEKLFFDSLKNMGLDGKVNLQRVEANGAINNVALNNNGVPVGTPCPN